MSTNMAASFRIFAQRFRFTNAIKEYPHFARSNSYRTVCALSGCCLGYAAYAGYQWISNKTLAITPTVYGKEGHYTSEEGREVKAAYETQRELRFLTFASLEHDGTVYMTPQDFLESQTQPAPRARIGRIRLSSEEIEKILKKMPSKRRNNEHLFKNLHNQGLISFTEYLFLLCVLTKPRSGFRIAFNMFDMDGNQRVDRNEFLVLERIITRKVGHSCQSERRHRGHRDLRNICDLAAQEEDVQNTSLMTYFFGINGKDSLKYNEFYQFMDNLQKEVIQLEFSEFSRGMQSISEEDFAKMVLKYTVFTHDQHNEYIDRLNQRIPQSKGITFEDFRMFCRFLNNLDDFAIAMRIYTMADTPISQSEFKRAVKICTGMELNSHLVHTVFQLFDQDGDGHLSHREFISVMRDRLHRGFKATVPHANRWEAYKACIKHQMRAS